MKIFMRVLTVLVLISCSTTGQDWENGAQRQEAIESETRVEQQEHIRNQFPARTF